MGRSQTQDRGRKAKAVAKPGQGDRGGDPPRHTAHARGAKSVLATRELSARSFYIAGSVPERGRRRDSGIG